jgi:putative DNA primase/helicase
MSGDTIDVREIVCRLASQIEQLVRDLLPNGHREGHEWRSGSVAGEPGCSLGVHLTGAKAGIWCDFAGDKRGDALDLIIAVLAMSKGEAVAWAKRWLGIPEGEAVLPSRPAPASKPPETIPAADRWRHPWGKARPIRGTVAEAYLEARGLRFDDPEGRVLRFAARRARKNLAGELEYHPAMLSLLSDLHSGEPCGIINCYLLPDGRDRVRDKKGKTSTGRVGGAVVLLSPFCEPCDGLVLCEGTETGIAIHQSELRPVWCCGSAGNLASFPVLGGIESLIIAADTGKAGQQAAATVTERWRQAGRKTFIVGPPAGDWADPT